MAERVSREEAQSGADEPIRLRRLRTENEFRESTRGIERREREKYRSMLWNMMRMDLAPKVQIMDLVGVNLDGVIGTHHIGGQTAQAQQAIADETVRIILEYRDEGIPPNLVA